MLGQKETVKEAEEWARIWDRYTKPPSESEVTQHFIKEDNKRGDSETHTKRKLFVYTTLLQFGAMQLSIKMFVL